MLSDLAARADLSATAKLTEATRHLVLDFGANAGVASGEFRNVSTKIATFAVLGMTNWLHVWYSPKGDLSLQEIADTFTDLVVSAVAADGAARTEATLAQSLDSLRSTVETLDLQVRQLRQSQRARP